MEQVAKLTYRLFEEKDLQGVLSLWKNFSGWGAISAQQFNDWYINTPLGTCLIIVAADEKDEVIGQLVFVPGSMYLYGKEVKALRLSAPVLHKDIRQNDLRTREHPAFMMVRKGIEIARQKDYHILYCLPAHGWTGLMKLLPQFGMPDIQMDTYNCAALSLNDEAIWDNSIADDLQTRVVNSFDTSYDSLWQEATINFPIACGITRSMQRLQWKISHHIVIEVRDDKRLSGYAAFKKNDGLLVDILATSTDELKKVLMASVKAMHYKNNDRLDVSFEAIKIMHGPQLKSLLNEINYQLVDFQFAFACYPLQNAINKKSIHPENWYIMPDD